MTRANALYLSTAVQFNSEQLKPIFLWFRDQLVILLKNGPAQEIYFNPDLTFQFLKDPQNSSLDSQIHGMCRYWNRKLSFN